MHDPKTREREIEGLVEAIDLHNLDSVVIITEHQEENLEIRVNARTVVIDILPAWKWLAVINSK